MPESLSQIVPCNREQFIKSYMPFIRNVATQQIGRLLEWGRDEELSIALIAFNSAIDVFELQKGRNFKSFARLIIKRRLIDYYRSNSHRRSWEFPAGDQLITLADNNDINAKELDAFLVQQRQREISMFIKDLQVMDIKLADLVCQAPKHSALRTKLLDAAQIISRDRKLHIQIIESGRIPLQTVSKLTGIHKSVLSKRRKYLLAVLLVYAHTADYPFISTYLNKGGDE